MEITQSLRAYLAPIISKIGGHYWQDFICRPSIVMVGLDSSGKSTLFRELSHMTTETVTHFRKSGITCRRIAHRELGCDLINAPDIRLLEDHKDTIGVLDCLNDEDTVILVVRGTDAVLDAARLLELLAEHIGNRPVGMVVTFRDKCQEAADQFSQDAELELGIPVTAMNARDLRIYDHKDFHQLVEHAAPLQRNMISGWEEAEAAVVPTASIFETPWIGKITSLSLLAAFFSATVFLGYLFASWGEGPFMQSVYVLLGKLMQNVPDGPFLFLLGANGEGPLTLTVGLFLWVIPLLVLYAIGHALVSESGIKDRVTTAVDPVAREIGLTGRDLLPVMCGYGCKVVGILESRRCGRGQRRPAVSFIGVGTTSFFQLTAAGILFAVLEHYWMIIPYIALVFLVGVVHNRVWYGVLPAEEIMPVSSPSFIQWPRMSAVACQATATVKEFLQHALPLFFLSFILIGFAVYFGGFDRIAETMAPLMKMFRLPPEASPALVWSLARKDIMIAMLSADAGGIMHTLNVGQIFVLVYFASVFSVTLPALFMVVREMGVCFAVKMASTQLLTAVITTLVLAVVVIPWF